MSDIRKRVSRVKSKKKLFRTKESKTSNKKKNEALASVDLADKLIHDTAAADVLDELFKRFEGDIIDCKQLWHRLKGESNRAYAAFRVYMEIEPTLRNYKICAQIIKERQEEYDKYVSDTVNIYQSVCAWGNKFSWPDRVAAYDKWVLEVRLKSRTHSILQCTEMHKEVSGKYIQALSLLTTALMNKLSKGGNSLKELEKIPMDKLLRLIQDTVPSIQKLVQIQRLSLGLSEKPSSADGRILRERSDEGDSNKSQIIEGESEIVEEEEHDELVGMHAEFEKKAAEGKYL